MSSKTELTTDVGARVFYSLCLSAFAGLSTYMVLLDWTLSAPSEASVVGALLTLCGALAGTLAYVLIRLGFYHWDRTTPK